MLSFASASCLFSGGRLSSDEALGPRSLFSPVSAFARVYAASVSLTDLVTCPALAPGVPFCQPHLSPDTRLAHVTASGEVAVTVQA